MVLKVSEALKRYVGKKHEVYIDEYIKKGNTTEAALACGVCRQTIGSAIKKAQKKMADAVGKICLNSQDCTHEKWLFIPDIQAHPDHDLLYVYCIGAYILHKKPTKIICIGDFADMPSLSSYDKGKRSYEGARYKNDIEAAITAQKLLMQKVNEFNEERRALGEEEYTPEWIMLLGNHEDRINRATQLDPMLHGTISIDDLKYKEFGWKVYPFLQVLVMKNIAFSHYFSSGTMNKACATAQQQLNKMHMSCLAGHQQGRQTASNRRADGRRITSIIAGSAYDYNMDFLGEQGNLHWRGVIMLHNIEDGEFDEVPVPIRYLKEKYGKGLDTMAFAPEHPIK